MSREPPFSVKSLTVYRTHARLVPTGEAGRSQAAAALRLLVSSFAAKVLRTGPPFWPPSRLLLEWTWRVEVDVGSASTSAAAALPFPLDEGGTEPPSAAVLTSVLLHLAAATLVDCPRTHESVESGAATRMLTRFSLAADHGQLRPHSSGAGEEEEVEELEVLSQPPPLLPQRQPCCVTALFHSIAASEGGGPSFAEACAALGLSEEERAALAGRVSGVE